MFVLIYYFFVYYTSKDKEDVSENDKKTIGG